MFRFSRSLATRLRRIARPQAQHPRSLGTRPASAEAWARLERALTATALPAPATRRRELAHEQLRLTITLVGQQGPSAVRRIRASGADESTPVGEALGIALAVAAALGYPS